jgi:hypothetical protein
MKGMLKWPLIIAAIFVVVRVVLEQAGSPEWLNNLFSVVILYLLVVPLYFSVRIANSGIERPYRTLLKMTALYTALARSMIIPTYWLAYHFQWSAPRFSVRMGGNVGPNVTPIFGYVLIPLGAAIAWIAASLVVGGGLGSIVIAIKRKKAAKAKVTAAD